MHRFFIEDEDVISSDTVVLHNEETHAHLVKVLRVKLGEPIELVAKDRLIIGNVSLISERSVTLKIETVKPHENESSIRVDLFQCIPKGQKLELILQKNVELGVNGFYLVDSKRCVVDFKAKDIPKKLERYQKIVKEAAKQSKRDMIPALEGVLSMKDVCKRVSNYDLFMVLYEKEDAQAMKAYLEQMKSSLKNVAILIGPEGGLEASEVELLMDAGAKSTTLGKRIFRTETAALVAVSCIQYEMDALN